MVQLSKIKGDPWGVRPGVVWVGSILKRCFPKSFEVEE